MQLGREQGLSSGCSVVAAVVHRAGDLALLGATELLKNGSVGKEKLPFPAAPKPARCSGWERQGVQVWAAPCPACSGSLLAIGGETSWCHQSEGEDGGGSARLPGAAGSTVATTMAPAQLCWGTAGLACGVCQRVMTLPGQSLHASISETGPQRR